MTFLSENSEEVIMKTIGVDELGTISCEHWKEGGRLKNIVSLDTYEVLSLSSNKSSG